ncbi:hypothetical protein B0H17DRAFT_1047001 [Mycena rosella]|uniref:Uncharacterized protein n=1 Tax=Mycena rosella TaxID=1033263 RepID=A0AAD7DUW2_MYCRO|nr:hypothetical protein B0H17DRAFT_1047001 [Mycena rosella]
MSSISNLPVLVLMSTPSLASSADRATERDIDRRALLDISPDREELFMGRKSIDEIRQSLKLRTGPTAGHWLYQTKRRANVNFRDATARTSTLIHRVKKPDENTPSEDVPNNVRRVLSTASLNRAPIPMPMTRIENGTPWSGVTVWGSFVLSTPNKLISPRPLGPTHILVVHTAPLSVSKSGKTVLPRSRGDATAKPSFPNADIPINDLLFLLNVPNLVTADGHCPLPRRLHKELPRALLRVPHLETIHELIVYLHTMNQAELFRKLIPEWMRDLMHPLPVAAPVAVPAQKGTVSIFSPKKQRSAVSLFGMLAPPKLASSASSTYSVDTLASSMSSHSSELAVVPEGTRALDSIARDIVDSLPFFSDEDPKNDELVSTLATLNALKANLECLGYFGKAVWDELEASIAILTRTLVRRAAVTAAEGEN